MSDDQFTKLTKQITDLQADAARQITDLNDVLGKLYHHMETRFDELEAKIDTKADAERVYTALDGIAGRLDMDDQERLAMSHQLDRQHDWIERLAKHTKAKLVPEP